jgi:hypothetical protein
MAYCEIKSINAPEKTYGDHLFVKNISVVDSWSYSDCSYKERIRFLFTPCDKRGYICAVDNNNIVEITLDIETGYLPKDMVGQSLKETLSRAFNIFKIDELIKVFHYRAFYCKI